MADVVIRRAVVADAPALARLRWDFKREDDGDALRGREEFVAACEAWLRTRLAGAWKAWLAEIDGEVHGHVFLCRVEKVPSPDRGPGEIGYVTNFYVAREWQDQGLGTAMLARLTAHARDHGLDTLIAWPSERSAPLWLRGGFTAPVEALELQLESG